MKKLILNWLFGTDNVKRYTELLDECIECHEECKRLIANHLKTLDDYLETLASQKEDIDLNRKLIRICENHGINIDEEIRQEELKKIEL